MVGCSLEVNMSTPRKQAVEEVVANIVEKLEAELKRNKDKPDVCNALKRVGRLTVAQITWQHEDAMFFSYNNIFR